MPKSSKKLVRSGQSALTAYDAALTDISKLIEQARHGVARSVNVIMTATYWQVGKQIVVHQQQGSGRAEYGAGLLQHLSLGLSSRFNRGFSVDNLETMRLFYLAYPTGAISETVSRKSTSENLSLAFPLSWSHYVMLVRHTQSAEARAFYETEALRGGWTIRQLDRQIGSQFYERTALSRNKAAMLTKGARKRTGDQVTPDEEIKDPYVLEFLNLKDEYSESQLEEALIHHLENFLLELGSDFAFVGRQRRLRVGDTWFRIDLLFFHRRLKCLILIDLKLDKFSHADVGQMNLYVNYARRHWTHPDENPPIGLILSARKNAAVAEYAMEGITNKLLTAEYRTILPDVETITAELERTRELLETRKAAQRKK